MTCCYPSNHALVFAGQQMEPSMVQIHVEYACMHELSPIEVLIPRALAGWTLVCHLLWYCWLTHSRVQKKENATPAFAQLVTVVGSGSRNEKLDPLRVPSVFLHWSAVKMNATNHMKAQRPLAAISTTRNSFFTYLKR